MARAILIVIDSLGVGGAPDAKSFGDFGANTLGNIISACNKGEANFGREGPLKIPNLEKLGIINGLRVRASWRTWCFSASMRYAFFICASLALFSIPNTS